MAIKIKSISFKNYRQYRSGTLHFNTDDTYKLSAFIAPNGTGKTTILNAITWCLYGKEYQITDVDKALPLVNEQAWNFTAEGIKIPVSVQISVVDEERQVAVDFIRVCRISRILGREKNWRRLLDDIEFTARVTYKTGNTRIYHGDAEKDPKIETAADIVNQFFDQSIYNFYFFDGEKLQSFFKTDLEKPIFSLSQVNVLRNTIDHMIKYRDAQNRFIAKNDPNLKSLQDELKEKEDVQSSLSKEREGYVKKQEEVKKVIGELEEMLRGYPPITNWVEERKKIADDLEQEKENGRELAKKKSEFIRKYVILLNLYPKINHTFNYINQKREEGNLPPKIDKIEVQKMIEHPEDGCPLCESPLTPKILAHLKVLLEKIAVSSKASNFLSEMQGGLERAKEETEQYKEKKENLQKRINEQNQEQSNLEEKLRDIDRKINEKLNNNGVDEVISAEARLKSAKQSKENAIYRIASLDTQLRERQGEIDLLRNKEKQAISDSKANESLKEKSELADRLRVNLENVECRLVSEMKKEIETATSQYFQSMIWKRHTFGKILIDDHYKVFVYNKQNVEMTSSLSATEKMALAYAFTLAIHEASGKNCPLLIDSPLGRVSDDNREKMAGALLEVSRNKQIIMLFTPDEYSKQVQDVFVSKIDSKKLNLSQDESQVEGLDPYEG